MWYALLRRDSLSVLENVVVHPILYFHSVMGFVEENKKHRIEQRDFDIQLDHGDQAVEGLSEDYGS